MTQHGAADVVVVGGGAIGLGVAWRAAQAGMAVTVVDEAPGRGASWAAAGMLAPVTEVHYGEQALLALNLEAAARVRGGVLAAGDHQVDNRALVVALLAACDRAGVTTRPGRVAEVRAAGGRVSGVTLAGGEALAAGTVVLAAGCWSGALGGLAAELLSPVRPVKGQLLHLRGPAGQPLCQRNVRGLEAYVVPRADGRVVVGATVEERGFDTRVTAGAVHDLLHAAAELLPDVAELELVEAVAGLRPGSPHNPPLLRPARPDGLLVATGHYRNGILLTPVTAAAVAELLAGGPVPEAIAPFSPRRFQPAARSQGSAP